MKRITYKKNILRYSEHLCCTCCKAITKLLVEKKKTRRNLSSYLFINWFLDVKKMCDLSLYIDLLGLNVFVILK